MNARLKNLAEISLVEMSGDIDHNNCGTLETALDDALAQGAPVVLIDLSGVSYIDSGGLSVIFSGARQLPQGGWLGLVGPNPDVRRLLELVGLFADPRFRVFDDKEAAEAALRARTTP